MCKVGRTLTTSNYIHIGCDLLMQRICRVLLTESRAIEDKRFDKVGTYQQQIFFNLMSLCLKEYIRNVAYTTTVYYP